MLVVPTSVCKSTCGDVKVGKRGRDGRGGRMYIKVVAPWNDHTQPHTYHYTHTHTHHHHTHITTHTHIHHHTHTSHTYNHTNTHTTTHTHHHTHTPHTHHHTYTHTPGNQWLHLVTGSLQQAERRLPPVAPAGCGQSPGRRGQSHWHLEQ